jgi:hypothetical protein
MKNSALIIAFMAITMLLLSTAQSRQGKPRFFKTKPQCTCLLRITLFDVTFLCFAEPLKLGRRLSQTDGSAAATAGGTGDSVSTSTGTSLSNGQTTSAMPTTTTTAVDGSSAAGSVTATTGTVAATPPIVPSSWPNVCNVWPWICFPPKMPPHPHMPPPPHTTPPPPHMLPSPHRPPIIKIPIFRHKEVKVIIVPPKPVPEIPICKGKIKEACCDSKDYCPWNWWYYPDKEPPKVCKVEVEVIKELKLCQWPVLVSYIFERIPARCRYQKRLQVSIKTKLNCSKFPVPAGLEG